MVLYLCFITLVALHKNVLRAMEISVKIVHKHSVLLLPQTICIHRKKSCDKTILVNGWYVIIRVSTITPPGTVSNSNMISSWYEYNGAKEQQRIATIPKL